MGKATVIGKINATEQKANSRWWLAQTKSGKERDELEADMQALDAEARVMLWTLVQMGYDIQRDGIGTVTDIVKR